MTLPIIDSMLRGDLRKQILSTLKTDKEISLLWRNLMKATQGEQSLMAIEKALIAAVETSGLVQVSGDYKDDREIRQGAEQARKQGMSLGGDDYTRVDKKVNLEGIFPPAQETTPKDKFLHLLVKVECCRTMECLLMLVNSVHDDGVVRTYIRKLFLSITSLCKDSKDIYIKESLTQFYFEVYHTFRNVLEKGDFQLYETDFENFVFGWKGEFPDKEVMARLNNSITEADTEIETSNLPQLTERPKLTTAAEKFTKFVAPFCFVELPLVKSLNAKQQAELIELIVKDACYAAAMLKYLGYYDRLRNVYQKTTNEEIIKHCAKSLGCAHSSFKKYFYSMRTQQPYTTYERHNAQVFLDSGQVESDYNRIKESQ